MKNFIRKNKLIREVNAIPVILGSYYNAYSLARSFCNNGIKPILITKTTKCFMKYSKYIKACYQLPDTNKDETAFLQALIDLGKKLQPQKGVVFATHDEELLAISKHKEELTKYYEMPFSDYDTLQKIMDKSSLTKVCNELSIPTIKEEFVQTKEDALLCLKKLRFPLIIKLAIWDDSILANLKSKIWIANDSEAYIKIITNFYENMPNGSILVQEYIEDSYKLMPTVNTVSDKNGDFMCVFVSLKVRQDPPQTGTSTSYKSVAPQNDEYNEIIEYTKKILKHYKYYGLAGAEYKFDPKDRKYKMIEINCRSEFPNYLQVIVGQEMAVHLLKYHLGISSDIPYYPLVKDACCYVPFRDRVQSTILNRFENRKFAITNKEWKKTIVQPHTLYGVTIRDPIPFVFAYYKEFKTVMKSLIRDIFRIPKGVSFKEFVK